MNEIEVMRGFGLVELLMEKTPYDYNRLYYCLTEKGKRMLERVLADKSMRDVAERVGMYIDAFSMMSLKELSEMVRQYE
jgi:DNA-binding PadR family transcriptional regulator